MIYCIDGCGPVQEVGRKSERITMLEKEKSSLIRELFQARSQQSSLSSTSTSATSHGQRPPPIVALPTDADNAFV